MADTPATIELEIIARLPGTEQEFNIGTIEIPVEINKPVVLDAIRSSIEEHRPTDG